MEKEKTFTFITGDLVEGGLVVDPNFKESASDAGDPYEVFQSGHVSRAKEMNQKVGAATASKKYEALLLALEEKFMSINHHMDFYKHVEMRYKEAQGDDAKIAFSKLAEIRAIDKETKTALDLIVKFKEINR